MNLSKNFTLEELIHSDTAIVKGIDNSLPDDNRKSVYITNALNLCQNVLQPIRNEIGIPMKSISGFRCPELNKEVGGESNSQHLILEADDVTVDEAQMTNEQLFQTIKAKVKRGEIEVDQCICEKRHIEWVHISFTTHRKNRNQFLRAIPEPGNKWTYVSEPL